MYTPLYPPEGAPVMGFACRQCGDVTKTEQGMVKHCLYAHGIKIQTELEFNDEQGPTEPIRDSKAEGRASEEPGSGETYPGPGDSIYRRDSEKG